MKYYHIIISMASYKTQEDSSDSDVEITTLTTPTPSTPTPKKTQCKFKKSHIHLLLMLNFIFGMLIIVFSIQYKNRVNNQKHNKMTQIDIDKKTKLNLQLKSEIDQILSIYKDITNCEYIDDDSVHEIVNRRDCYVADGIILINDYHSQYEYILSLKHKLKKTSTTVLLAFIIIFIILIGISTVSVGILSRIVP